MLKRIALGLVLLTTITLIVAAFLTSRSHAQLESRLAELRKAGDPATIAGLEKPDVAPEQNAVTYLKRAGSEASQLYAAIADAAQPEDFDWSTGLSEQQLQIVADGFAKHPMALPLIQQACQQNVHLWPYDYTATPQEFLEANFAAQQTLRASARVLDCRARQLASLDQPQEACEVYLQLLQLSRLHESEPLLTAFLTNLAIRGMALNGLGSLLQHYELAPETHLSIEAELQQHEEFAGFVNTLKSERAFGIESFRALMGKFGMMFQDWANYLDVMQAEIELGSASLFETNAAPAVAAGRMASTVTPAIASSREALSRTRALVRVVRIANAAIHSGASNGNLDISNLNLPASTFTDPFTGKPLLIEQGDAGWLIYSVGVNQQDDSGEFQTLQDVGVGPIQLK